ncbi:MAG TPA: epimerase [Clostridiales bacterium]|nr:epimerase [Clostridiales bacterium]
MKILVMGGTEFVGRAVAEYMISRGHEVSIFTRGIREPGYNGIQIHYKGDRRSADVENEIKGEEFDYILDISAYALSDVENLLNKVNTKKLKRYIFLSTGSVYKPSNEHMNEEQARGFNENWGQYGMDKLDIEDYLFRLHKDEGLPMSIVRPTYIYGKGNNLYREIYLFERLEKALTIPIPDSGNRVQFIYIDDVVQFIESIMFEDKSIGQAYNITHPEAVTWEKLIYTAANAMNTDTVKIKKISGTDLKPREYFPFRDCTYLLDIDKAGAHGLTMSSIDLAEGLRLSYEWYKDTKPVAKDSKMDKVEIVLKYYV